VAHLVVAVVTPHAAVELLWVDPVHELGENSFAGVRVHSLASEIPENRKKSCGRAQIAHTSFPAQHLDS